MADSNLERFLQVVVSDLKAEDARVEIGGRPPTDPCVVACPFGEARLVAIFATPPDDAGAVERRLSMLYKSFGESLETAVDQAFALRGAADPQGDLESALKALAVRAGATRALVSDLSAPIIWGLSAAAEGSRAAEQDVVDTWVRELSTLHAPQLRSSHGHVVRLTLVDEHECLARLFGGTYVLSMYFEQVLSEPAAVGALLRATPTIEKLVLSLPPVEPPPGGKVLRLAARIRSV